MIIYRVRCIGSVHCCCCCANYWKYYYCHRCSQHSLYYHPIIAVVIITNTRQHAICMRVWECVSEEKKTKFGPKIRSKFPLAQFVRACVCECVRVVVVVAFNILLMLMLLLMMVVVVLMGKFMFIFIFDFFRRTPVAWEKDSKNEEEEEREWTNPKQICLYQRSDNLIKIDKWTKKIHYNANREWWMMVWWIWI